jgi:hypothetical protein
MEQSQKSQKQPEKRQSRSTTKKKSKRTGKENNKLNEILFGLFLVLIIALIVAFSSNSVESLLLVLVKFILLIIFYVLLVFFFKRILKVRRSPKISKKQVSESSRKSKRKKEQKITIASVEELVHESGRQESEKLQEIEKGQETKQTEKSSSEEKTPEKEIEQKITIASVEGPVHESGRQESEKLQEIEKGQETKQTEKSSSEEKTPEKEIEQTIEEQVGKVSEKKQEKQPTGHPETQEIKTVSEIQKAPTKSLIKTLFFGIPSHYSSSSKEGRKLYNCNAPDELLLKYNEAEKYISEMKKEVEENLKLSDEEEEFLRKKLRLIQLRANQISLKKKVVEEKKKKIVEECLNQLKSKENLKNYERQYLSHTAQVSIDAGRYVGDEKKKSTAFAYAYLLILLMKDFKELEKILTSLFYVNCIYTVPLFCLPSKEEMTREEYQVNVLKRIHVRASNVDGSEERVLETEDDYLIRMSGIISIFFSINIFPQGREKEQPNLDKLWSWLQNFIRQDPNKYAVKMLDTFFSYVGPFLFFWPERKYFNNDEEQKKFREYLEKLKKTFQNSDDNTKVYLRALESNFSNLVKLYNKGSPGDLSSEYPDILTENPPKDSIIMEILKRKKT